MTAENAARSDSGIEESQDGDARLLKEHCRFLMADVLEWSAEADNPLVRDRRGKLSHAYADLLAAVVKTADPARREFLKHYPPFRTFANHSPEIVDAAYPAISFMDLPMNGEAGPRTPEDPPEVRVRPKLEVAALSEAAAPPPETRAFGDAARSDAAKPDGDGGVIDPRTGRALGD